MAPYSSEEEDFSGSEEELSEEVRAMHGCALAPPSCLPCSPGRRSQPLAPILQSQACRQPAPCPQELAAALAVQRERAARGGGAAPGPAGSDGEEEDEEGEGGGRGGGAPLREAIYNVEALHDKLEDIAWSEEQPWEESLALTGAAPTVVVNAEDDLERELAFYNQVRVCVCVCEGGNCRLLVRTGEVRVGAAGRAQQPPPRFLAGAQAT